MNYDNNKFNSLCAFVRAEADGTANNDVTYRSYNLDKGTGAGTFNKALTVLGRNSLSELSDDLRCIGLLPVEGATGVTCRWYVWYRLCKGVLTRWPLRQ